jgi:hypothetical protein
MNSKAQIRPASGLIPQGTIKESTAALRLGRQNAL